MLIFYLIISVIMKKISWMSSGILSSREIVERQQSEEKKLNNRKKAIDMEEIKIIQRQTAIDEREAKLMELRTELEAKKATLAQKIIDLKEWKANYQTALESYLKYLNTEEYTNALLEYSQIETIIASRKKRGISFDEEKLRTDLRDVLYPSPTNQEEQLEEEITEEQLLQKEGMTEEDKQAMREIIAWLRKKNQLNKKNIRTLRDNIEEYNPDYIKIAGEKIARNTFKPNIAFNDHPDERGVYASNKEGIFKQRLVDWKEEYYLTPAAYAEQAGGKGFSGDDLNKISGDVLWKLFWLSMSGCVRSKPEQWDKSHIYKGAYGYLGSTTYNTCNATVFKFDESENELDPKSDVTYAYPCLVRYEG